MTIQAGDVTFLLRQWRAGDRASEERLFDLILPDLRRMARSYLSRERRDHTLEPTELVDQIYFRLVAAKDRDWQNRGHFFAIAARAMRRYLIDHARKRPDAVLVEFEAVAEGVPAASSKIELAVMIDRILDELAESKPEWCALVELKYFLGLTNDEAAEVLNLTDRTISRYWHDARRWLFERLGGTPGEEPEEEDE
jgi:RNA polymerase sigma factor (TIGR02999 family)